MPREKLAIDAPERQNHVSQIDWSSVNDAVLTTVSGRLSDPEVLASDPGALREALDQAVVKGIEMGVERVAQHWAEQVVGAGRYERCGARRGYLSGQREHVLPTPLGPITVRVPRPRRGASRPSWLPALKKAPQKVVGLVRELWLRGLSTRDLSKVSENVAGVERSHETLAGWVRDIADEVLKWLNRPIDDRFVYLALDALYVPVRRETSKREAVLVALGITEKGHKEVLDVLHAPTESGDSWGTLVARLKMRGLAADNLRLVISDGDAGLIQAIEQHLPGVRRQRCTVHKVRNVVGRCPRHLKSTAPAEASKIFKAPSREEAERRAKAFIDKHRDNTPRIADVIADDLDAALAFYDFDSSKWRALCSTNALERLHRELRRKFTEVGAMQGDRHVMRVAVQVAQFVNEEMKDKPIAGFRPKRRPKSAPSS